MPSDQRAAQLAIDLEQVGRHLALVFGFALRRQILPAGHRATADVRSAKTATREMLNRVVTHRVIEGDLFAASDRFPGDEVTGAGLVQLDPAVGAAGVIDLRSETAMASPTGAADLGRVRIVVSNVAFEKSDHHRLTGLKATSCANTTALVAFGSTKLIADRIQGTASQLVGRNDAAPAMSLVHRQIEATNQVTRASKKIPTATAKATNDQNQILA